MSIKNEQPNRRYNHDFLSHKCHLDGALNTENQIKLSSEGKDHLIETPRHYQCHKFRRVCMVMGVLVLIEESEHGGVSYQELMPKDYIQRSGRHKKAWVNKNIEKYSFSSATKFNISTQLFKQDSKAFGN